MIIVLQMSQSLAAFFAGWPRLRPLTSIAESPVTTRSAAREMGTVMVGQLRAPSPAARVEDSEQSGNEIPSRSGAADRGNRRTKALDLLNIHTARRSACRDCLM